MTTETRQLPPLDLRAAIVDVIFARNIPAGIGKQPRQGVANHSTPDMSHMHRAGRVG